MKCSTRLTPISWNTRDYLLTTLKGLNDRGVVRHWVAIRHQGEHDLVQDRDEKDHWHLLLILGGEVQVEKLLDEFKEPDPTHPDKPLGCYLDPELLNVKARSENRAIASWLLYGLHDEEFLRAIGEERQFHYKWEDFLTDSEEWLHAVRRLFNRRFGEFADLRRPPLAVVTEMVMAHELTVNECLRKGWISPVVARSLSACLRDQAMELEKVLEDHRTEAVLRMQEALRNSEASEKREAEARQKADHLRKVADQFESDVVQAFLDQSIARKEANVNVHPENRSGEDTPGRKE